MPQLGITEKNRASHVRLALALFCLLTCLYWLTNSAHIRIADGETMYLVTESLVERGTFAQLEPEQAGDAPNSLMRARDGNLYAVTGPLQSMLAIPCYLLGQAVARHLPAPFYGYLTRFFVCLFNSPALAATTALLYLFSIDLGYRRRTAIFLALTFGLATIAWPYARTLFAETLHTFWLMSAAWAAYRYAHTDQWGWMALVGAAMGLGTATKYVMLVAGPALALYLLLEFLRRPQHPMRWMGRTVLSGAIPFALILAALLMLNYARFDSIWETGYTQGDPSGTVGAISSTATPILSLYGLFFSSGKGFFFFSPPTVLALWGILGLARRRRNETWLFLAIAVSYPLFYSLITPRWHGGGNWGPRYIVCITPFLTLLVGPFLEQRDLPRWLRMGAATLLFVAGFWVQMSTLFVNYSTYLFSDVPADQQRFHPAYSTLAAQWRLWPRQTAAWQEYDHDLRTSGEPFYTLGDGFHGIEVDDLAPFGRWMEKRGQLCIYARPDQTLTIQVSYSRPHLDNPQDGPPRLHLLYDGAPVVAERWLIDENERETRWQETLRLPADEVRIFPGTLEMTATTWMAPGDPRELSVFVERIDVLSDGAELPARDANLPRPLPLTTAYPWSWEAMFWFYDPANARPFDLWPWYLWTSGLPLPQARTLIIILGLVLGSGLTASATWFVLELRRNL